jgi:hypothetical protein
LAPEPVWTLWRREKSLSLAGSRISAVEPVARYYTDCTSWGVRRLRTQDLGRSKVGLPVGYVEQNEEHKVRNEIPVEAGWEVNQRL